VKIKVVSSEPGTQPEKRVRPRKLPDCWYRHSSEMAKMPVPYANVENSFLIQNVVRKQVLPNERRGENTDDTSSILKWCTASVTANQAC
jgi:hypothetical protein